MRATVVRVGNSRLIGIPKALLEECAIRDVVELSVQHGRLIVTPVGSCREGWKEAAVEMARMGEDQLLDPDFATELDATEWEW
jgi:antitoxin MazE